jgi:putative membrane protein
MDLAPVTAFVAGFPDFVIHLGAAFGLFVGSLMIYVLMTPHKELQLIRAGNPSAALAFGGIVVGLAIPLGACLANAFGLLDLLLWGVVTLLLQLLAFRVAQMVLRDLPRRIAEGDVAAAIFLLAINLALALILAGAVQDPALNMMRAAAPFAAV